MHFEDFKDDKGIVLMRGEVDVQQKSISVDDATALVMGVQKIYGADTESERGRHRRALIEKFTKGAEDFDIDNLMSELDRVE